MRIRFKQGKQREFLRLVVNRLNCISLRGILQFGLDIKYDCLKSYYCERRLMEDSFFNDLCYLSKLNPKDFNIEFLKDNWGQRKSRKSKKSKKEWSYQESNLGFHHVEVAL